MQYRTEIKRTKGLGTAKHGFGHWWMQRLSAVLMLPLGLWFVISLMTMPSLAPDDVIQWLQHPIPALLMMLWTITVVYHAALGLQVIIEDYVHNKKTSLTLLVLLKFAMLVLLAMVVFSLFKIVL